MALQLIKKISPCMQYFNHPTRGVYNPYLAEGAYGESINGVNSFFYLPAEDKYYLIVTMDITEWPGWAVYRYEFDAEGIFVKRQEITIWGMAYARAAGPGVGGGIYAVCTSDTKVRLVEPKTLMFISGAWNWTSPYIFNNVAVNTFDGVIVGVNGYALKVVQDFTGAHGGPTTFTLQIPGVMGYITIEDRDNLWLTTSSGQVLKLHYRRNPPRWAVFSVLQDRPADALNFLSAFDFKRKRLGVFVWRPDDGEGEPQSEIQFYRPLIQLTGQALTDPVPVSSLRAGEVVRFIAHLHGDQGEGVSAVVVNGALQAPAEGSLTNLVDTSLINGVVKFGYRAPAEGGNTETLVLTSTVTG